MKLKEGFALRHVGGNNMVVPVGAATLDFRCVITLNDTGAFLWKQLQQPATVDGLTAALLEEYDVEETLARADVERFVTSLREASLLHEDE